MLVAAFLSLTLLKSQGNDLLDSVPNLAEKITVEYPAETVDQVLADLTQKTGVKLLPANPIRDDVVILYEKDLPAKEVLRELAEHFDWTWEKDQGALVLRQSARQAKQEQDALREQIARPFRDFVKAAAEALRVPSGTKDDLVAYNETLAANQRLLDNYDSEYIHGSKDDQKKWSTEFDEAGAKMYLLARKLSPAWRLVDLTVANLSQADLVELARQTRLVFSYSPTRWQYPLSSPAMRAAEEWVRAVAQESSKRSANDADTFQRLRDFGLESRRAFRPEEVGTVRVTIHQSFFTPPSIQIGLYPIQVAIIAKNGEKLAEDYVSGRDPRRQPPAPKEARPKDEFDTPLEETPELKEALSPARDGRSSKAAQDASDQFLTPGSKIYPSSGIAHILIEAAKAGNINVIADAYDGPFHIPGWRVATLREALDGFGRVTGEAWAKKGDWIALRHRDWQYARYVTAPASKLFALRDISLQDVKALDMGLLAVSLVSDRQVMSWQFQSLFRNKRCGEWFFDQTQAKLYALRFWASLSPDDRQRLEGGPVRFGSLTPNQQGLLTAMVYRLDQRDFEHDVEMMGGKESGLEKDDVAWIAKMWPKAIDSDRWLSWDTEPSQQFPSGIPSDALVSAHTSQVNALVIANGDGWSMAMSEASAIRSGYYKPGSAEFTAQPAVEDRLFLTVDTQTASKGLELPAITPDGEAKSVHYSDLPEATRNRLEKAYRAMHEGG
ncbi:MAG TPA: hypothetical protein VHE55_10515 [Fimbriimonadaceae bacterium]|nr:hypothetical protein [Fimbriimonadaceae bacterium]